MLHHLDIARLLLQSGADPSQQVPFTILFFNPLAKTRTLEEKLP